MGRTLRILGTLLVCAIIVAYSPIGAYFSNNIEIPGPTKTMDAVILEKTEKDGNIFHEVSEDGQELISGYSPTQYLLTLEVEGKQIVINNREVFEEAEVNDKVQIIFSENEILEQLDTAMIVYEKNEMIVEVLSS